MTESIQSVIPLLKTLQHDMMPSQTALLLIRYCIMSRLSYLCRVTRPAIIMTALQQLDTTILHTVIDKLELPKMERMELHTKLMIQLPIKLGGIGIPSLADTSQPAFLSSLCLALPAIHASLEPHGQYMQSLREAHAVILSPNTGVIASDHIPVSVPALLATYSKPTPLATSSNIASKNRLPSMCIVLCSHPSAETPSEPLSSAHQHHMPESR